MTLPFVRRVLKRAGIVVLGAVLGAVAGSLMALLFIPEIAIFSEQWPSFELLFWVGGAGALVGALVGMVGGFKADL